MTKYYFNENPQVTYLSEKIKEQEKEIQHWKGMCDELQRELEIVKDNFNKVNVMAGKRYKVINDFHKQVYLFYTSPWHKRMFYKFKL